MEVRKYVRKKIQAEFYTNGGALAILQIRWKVSKVLPTLFKNWYGASKDIGNSQEISLWLSGTFEKFKYFSEGCKCSLIMCQRVSLWSSYQRVWIILKDIVKMVAPLT